MMLNLHSVKTRLEELRQEAYQNALAPPKKRKPFLIKKQIGSYVFSIKRCEPIS